VQTARSSDADSPLATETLAERIAAIQRAAAEGSVEALPGLERTVLADEPELAPTIILSIAALANKAGDAEREGAAKTLDRWLQEESSRAASDARGDARGNVAVIVDALGALASSAAPAAVDALRDALDAQRLPLHVETVAVQGLFKSGDARAHAAVERFGARVAALPQTTGFEEELRQEAALAARAAQARLGS
jgi:hypothetical protein